MTTAAHAKVFVTVDIKGEVAEINWRTGHILGTILAQRFQEEKNGGHFVQRMTKAYEADTGLAAATREEVIDAINAELIAKYGAPTFLNFETHPPRELLPESREELALAEAKRLTAAIWRPGTQSVEITAPPVGGSMVFTEDGHSTVPVPYNASPECMELAMAWSGLQTALGACTFDQFIESMESTWDVAAVKRAWDALQRLDSAVKTACARPNPDVSNPVPPLPDA